MFMVFVSIFAGFLAISSLGHMTSIGTLLAFVIVCIGEILMRKTNPGLSRPYRTPLVPLVPILGAIGLVIYFIFGKSHSHLRRAR
jgi:basic amino acid/polyamine antiporter, APA family